MIGQFGYGQSPFFQGISPFPQRVLGLPLQTSGIPVQYVAVPTEAISPRIIPTAGWINPLAQVVHPAFWQTAPFFQGLPPQQGFSAQGFGSHFGSQGLPQQGFGVPQSGIQALPVSQLCLIPVAAPTQGYGMQGLQVPHAGVNPLFQPLLQGASWGSPTGFDPTGGFLGLGY